MDTPCFLPLWFVGQWVISKEWFYWILPQWSSSLVGLTNSHCFYCFSWPTVLLAGLRVVVRALAKVSLVGVKRRIQGNDECGLHPNNPPADFQRATVSGSRGVEAIYWQLWLSQLSVGDQPGKQVSTNMQMLLTYPHSVSLCLVSALWLKSIFSSIAVGAWSSCCHLGKGQDVVV